MRLTTGNEDGGRAAAAFFAAIFWVATLIFVIRSFASWRLTGEWPNPVFSQLLVIPDVQSAFGRSVLNWLADCRIINSLLVPSLIFSWLAARR